MKKIIILTFLLLSAMTFSQKKEKVKGSKIVKLEQKKIENFNSIEVEDNLEVFLIKGNDCALEVEADDNLIEFIDFKVNDKNLSISTSKDLSSYKKLSVRITYTDALTMVIAKDETNTTSLFEMALDNITFKTYDYAKSYITAKTKNFTLMVNDKSKIELNLKSEKTAIDVSKSATVKAQISSNDMKCDMYQKSDATIEGTVNNLKLRLDNNSEFNGKKLIAKNAALEITASAKNSINVSNIITIDASGNSEIDLYGEPTKIEMMRFSDSAILTKKSALK